MADVNISKYRASVVREGSKPATPGFVVSEGQDPVNPPGTNNFVPYSGATANVELGEFGVEAGFVTLDITPTNTPTDQGTIFWDADDETVDVILNGYTMKIGEDLFYPVKNQTGSTIAKGVAVRFNGTVGASGRLLIAPFIADGSVPSSRFMGVTAEEILNGEDGKVLYFGRVRGINTDAFNEGDILYASTTVAGGFQTAIPLPPNNIVQIAAVVTKSATVGTIFVRPTLGSNINADEGVKITSVADKNLLQYQSATSLWENKTLAQVIGSDYVSSTRNITINGTTQDLSADRTYNVGTVTSVGLSSATSGVTIGSTPVTSSGTITLAIATASGSQNGLLSSTDWTTFNNKQNALTNPVTGTGTTNYLPKFTGASTIGNSNIADGGITILNENPVAGQFAWQFNGNTTTGLSFGANVVAGTNSSDIAFRVLNAAANSTRFLVRGDGNVGIGTDSPTATLNIRSLNSLNSDTLAQVITRSELKIQYRLDDLSSMYFGGLGSERGYIQGVNNAENAGADISINPYGGNLGLGVTPSAWGIYKAYQVGWGSIASYDGADTAIFSNAFFDGGTWRYIGTGLASQYRQLNSIHSWHTAPSGTAGNAISFTQAMTLTSGGNLLVGTTSDNGARLQVSGNARITGSINEQLVLDYTAVSGGFTWQSFRLNGTNRYRIFGNTNNSFTLWSDILSSNVLSIASTGAATFSSSVTAAQFLASSSSNAAIITSTGTTGYGLVAVGSSGGARDIFLAGQSGFSNGFTVQYTGTEMRYGFQNGNVGIGTSSPNSAAVTRALTISGTFDSILEINYGSTRGGYFYTNSINTVLSSVQSVPLLFNTSDIERMRITSGGNVLIGTTTDNGARLQVSGSATINGASATYPFNVEAGAGGIQISLTRVGANSQIYMGGSTGAGTQLYISSNNSGGVRLDAGATAWVSASDIRLKNIGKKIENAIQSLSQMQTIYYSWKNSTNQKNHLGLIAQEVEKQFPEIVSESQIDGMKGVNYTELIPVLIAAIKELKQEIDTLKN